MILDKTVNHWEPECRDTLTHHQIFYKNSRKGIWKAVRWKIIQGGIAFSSLGVSCGSSWSVFPIFTMFCNKNSCSGCFTKRKDSYEKDEDQEDAKMNMKMKKMDLQKTLVCITTITDFQTCFSARWFFVFSISNLLYIYFLWVMTNSFTLWPQSICLNFITLNKCGI